MHRIPTLLCLALVLVACGADPRLTPPAAATAAPSAAPAPAPARVTACAATPSTVYGAEPVVFEVSGEAGGGALVELEVLDQRERSVFRGSTAVPGRVQAGQLASGDFSLRFASSAVTCWVTVNRELPRASSTAR